jgi:hypothetical protein
MRVFRIAVSLWYDPLWWRMRRRSWKTRRYWLARPPAIALDGRALALQLGPFTLRFLVQGTVPEPVGAAPRGRPRGNHG